MKIIIFEFFVLIKYLLFIISILGILDLAHRKKLVQASVQSLFTTLPMFQFQAYRSNREIWKDVKKDKPPPNPNPQMFTNKKK